MSGAGRGRTWARLLVAGLAVGTVVGATNQALAGLVDDRPWDWVEMAFHVVLWTAIMPPVWSMVARVAGRSVVAPGPVVRTRAQLQEVIASALRTGALPTGANPDFWNPALADEVRRWNGLRWFTAVYASAAAVLVALAAVVANDDAWDVWAVAVVVAAFGVAGWRSSGRRLTAARRLLAGTAGSVPTDVRREPTSRCP